MGSDSRILTSTITVIRSQVFITGGDLVLNEPDNVSQSEGSSTSAAGQSVGRDSRCWGAPSFSRAVRIRWEKVSPFSV